MKTWLTKFRISSAIDAKKPCSPGIKRAICQSRDLQQFAEDSDRLDQLLKSGPAQAEAPPFLHDGIMRALERAGDQPAARGQGAGLRWVTAAVMLIAAIVGVVYLSPRTGSGRSGTGQNPVIEASSSLELSQDFVREAPGMVMSPLTEELQRLDRDFTNTQTFLLASLP